MDERTTSRKIVHIDMDAFYASVEQRDDPNLLANPWLWHGRAIGLLFVRPLMRRGSSVCARRCLQSLLSDCARRPSSFHLISCVTKKASRGAREIFHLHTDLIEPLSLDEAYLDVTENKTDLPTATRVAKTIRQQIREELNLTASAGVAPNKFLAKIASDWRKPDGLFVIQPHAVQDFLLPLPVGRIPGVGKVTESRMKAVGIATVGDLYRLDLSDLEGHFGSYGTRLYQLARGIDHNPVVANRVSKSISAEDTFQIDIPLAETEQQIRRLAEKVWRASRENARGAKTVVLKLKTKEFNSLTRSVTPSAPSSSCDELTTVAALRGESNSGTTTLSVGKRLAQQFQLDVESPLFEKGHAALNAETAPSGI